MKRIRDDSDLSPEQQQVLDLVVNGQNVFFTGSAGTGKSYTLRKIISTLQSMYDPKTVHVTASTGVAATNIGGTTLHSYAAIGLGNEPVEQIVNKVSKYRGVAERWRNTRVLIVDEVSMIPTDFFVKLDAIARRLRNNLGKPFGGIQMVLSGDFLQLPSIDKRGGLLFQCSSWKAAITNVIELKTVFRQKDAAFIALLQDLRKGIVTDEHDAFLKSRLGLEAATGPVKPTKLYSHRADVDQENALQLDKLNVMLKVYVARDSGPKKDEASKMFMAPTALSLKVGAQVILIANLQPPLLVNGSRGVVISFHPITQDPIVQFNSGVTQMISEHVWESKRGEDIVVKRVQIPLMLGWAMSIHKSQGMTLDLMETDISQCWDPGQAYVALSRATSIEGLALLGYRRECIKADPEVLKFYESIE